MLKDSRGKNELKCINSAVRSGVYRIFRVQGNTASTMIRSSDPNNRNELGQNSDRYCRFTIDDALVVYNRNNVSEWFQSDTVLSLAEMR